MKDRVLRKLNYLMSWISNPYEGKSVRVLFSFFAPLRLNLVLKIQRKDAKAQKNSFSKWLYGHSLL